MTRRIFAYLFLLVIQRESLSLPWRIPQSLPEEPIQRDPATGQVSHATPSRIHLIPQVSILTLSEVVLINNAFRVPYSDSFTGIPAFFLRIATPLFTIKNTEFFGEVRVGYGGKGGETRVFSIQSDASSDESMRLYWVPFSAAIRVQHALPGFEVFLPTLAVGVGEQWIGQRGGTSTLRQDFWIPFFHISPGLTFMGGRRTEDWFGGFSFGVTYQDSFATEQTVRSWAMDLSMSFFL